MRFNADLFWKIVPKDAPGRRNFLSRFLLAWAAFDGSILPYRFEVLVPADNNKDSIKNLMIGIFRDFFGIAPAKSPKETCMEDGKAIITLRVTSKKDRVKLRYPALSTRRRTMIIVQHRVK